MNAGVTMKTTRYGLSQRVGGWDGVGDFGTDDWLGNAGNTLNRSSCALTHAAEDALARSLLAADAPQPGARMTLPAHQLLVIEYDDARFNRLVTFDDRAPEDDARLDIFLPYHDDVTIPDKGRVRVVI